MPEISLPRLYLLRAMYLFMAAGLLLVVWPSILFPHSTVADPRTVVRSLLGAIGLLSLLGIRYPVQMLPLLLFEFLWKAIWVLAFAVPMWRGPGLDAYASESVFECLIGVVLLPIVLPWGYLLRHYVKADGDPWLARRPPP